MKWFIVLISPPLVKANEIEDTLLCLLIFTLSLDYASAALISETQMKKIWNIYVELVFITESL